MAGNDEMLAQFQNITGCDSDRAQFYLESSNWQLDVAMASFYEGDQDGDMDVMDQGEPAKETQPAAEDVAAPPGSRIRTLDVSDSDSDEEGQAFYAGGSTNSGQQILGPKKKKFDVGNMFKAARAAGAEEVDVEERQGGSSQKMKAFQGGGFKLGSDTVASTPVGMEDGATAKPEERHFVLKMWKEGFSLDDGDLRKYEDPANREFLASVMRGSIPSELVREAKGGEVHVDMEDHREEEFVKPKVKAKPFQGSGNVLGSMAPSVSPPKATAADPAQAEAAAQAQAKVDTSAPVANIQVRMADGTRLVVRLNHSHTVADIAAYIRTARPQYQGVEFALLTTFPNKELTDGSQTLKDAGLVGAAILQRLK